MERFRTNYAKILYFFGKLEKEMNMGRGREKGSESEFDSESA